MSAETTTTLGKLSPSSRETGRVISPRSVSVPLTALVGALSAAAALIAIGLLVAGYAT